MRSRPFTTNSAAAYRSCECSNALAAGMGDVQLEESLTLAADHFERTCERMLAELMRLRQETPEAIAATIGQRA